MVDLHDLSLWMVELGILEIIVLGNADCDDDKGNLEDGKNVLLPWPILLDLESRLLFDKTDNAGNDGEYNERVCGNSSYVNGGILRCVDTFGFNEVTVKFECSSLWIEFCWVDARRSLVPADVW